LVAVKGKKIEKPGQSIARDSIIEILGKEHPYVSRGGLKLKKAIDEFHIEVKGRNCLDVGASTEGL